MPIEYDIIRVPFCCGKGVRGGATRLFKGDVPGRVAQLERDFEIGEGFGGCAPIETDACVAARRKGVEVGIEAEQFEVAHCLIERMLDGN